MNCASASIILIDDSKADQTIVRRALEDSPITVTLFTANNGLEGLTLLRKLTQNQKAPDLILLDLNMPILNGLETLVTLKSDAQLKQIPVIMLSTSGRQQDITASYKNGANAYVIKPLEHLELIEYIQSV